MKNLLVLFVMIILVAAACNSNTGKAVAPAEKSPSDSPKNYLPVSDFIKEDIRRVDSFGGAILFRTTLDNARKDSSYIDLATFKSISSAFLPAELEIASFQQNFLESSFVDQSTQVVNFLYTPKNNDLSIRKVVLYIPPSLGTDKVNRIYLEKEFKKGDTLVSQKLTWKMKNYFIIAESRQTPDGKNSIITRKAIWDTRLFNEE